MKAFLFVITVPRVFHEKALYKKDAENHEKGVSFTVEYEKPRTKADLNSRVEEIYPKCNGGAMNPELKSFAKKFGLTVYANDRSGPNVNGFANGVALGPGERFIQSPQDLETENLDKSSKLNARRSLQGYVTGMKQDSEGGADEISDDIDVDEDDGLDDVPMEKMVEQTLSSLGVPNTAWSADAGATHAQLAFGVHGGARCERVLLALRACGVGARAGSSLSVLPCALHYGPSGVGDAGLVAGQTQDNKDSTWNTFVRSVRSRLTVAQVTEQVQAGAALTFDFFFLLVVAALTAAIGLAEDSTVFLVASMLISPLMGPITAGTFGTAIQDRNLQRMGLVHEIIGLVVALVVGFVFGLIICGINENYGVGEWPTLEITSRCEIRSLWVGALIAVPSGAAVAIAILAGNTTSLVGVAISASLLPPAVNAGLLWAMSLVHLIFLEDETRFTTVVKTQTYSDNPVIELAVNGTISLLLTVVNIVCIFFAGILVYMIKKVAPSDSQVNQFWKSSMKAARDYNKTKHEEKQESGTGQGTQTPTPNIKNFENALERAMAWEAFHQSDFYDPIKANAGNMTWSPAPTFTGRPSAREIYGRYRRLSEEPVIKRPHLYFRSNSLITGSGISESTDPPALSPILQPLSKNMNGGSLREPIGNASKFKISPVNELLYKTNSKNNPCT